MIRSMRLKGELNIVHLI